ncbi:hypothetical protein ACQJBY_062146 [Aegilops geniculata]
MKGAIETALPHTKHRCCKWHVLRDAKRNIGHVYNKFSGFKKEFNKLVNEFFSLSHAAPGMFSEHILNICNPLRPKKISLWVTQFLQQENYWSMIDHGDKRTKIHGIGWQRFLDEYAVRPGDMVYICLPRGNGRFFVDVERAGIRQLLFFFVYKMSAVDIKDGYMRIP